MRGLIGIPETTNERYKHYYREVHMRNSADNPATMLGEMLMCWVWDIQDLCKRYRPANYLDFGCGKGYAYRNRKVDRLFDCSILMHDIGIPEYSERPDPDIVDAIVCCDVLEHIPEELLPEVLSYWGRCKPKFVFATVAQYPSVATLADGTNAHVTQRSRDWWEALLAEHLSCPTVVAFGETPQGYKTYSYRIK
jgi:hypothetical protein